MASNVTARPPMPCDICGTLMWEDIWRVQIAGSKHTKFLCENCYDFFRNNFKMPFDCSRMSIAVELERIQELWELHYRNPKIKCDLCGTEIPEGQDPYKAGAQYLKGDRWVDQPLCERCSSIVTFTIEAEPATQKEDHHEK